MLRMYPPYLLSKEVRGDSPLFTKGLCVFLRGSPWPFAHGSLDRSQEPWLFVPLGLNAPTGRQARRGSGTFPGSARVIWRLTHCESGLAWAPGARTRMQPSHWGAGVRSSERPRKGLQVPQKQG